MAKNAPPATEKKQVRSLDQASFNKAMAAFLRPSPPRRKADSSQNPSQRLDSKIVK